MKAAGLTFSKILSLTEAGSLDLPIGKIQESQSLLTVDYVGGYKNIGDVSNLEIGYSGGDRYYFAAKRRSRYII